MMIAYHRELACSAARVAGPVLPRSELVAPCTVVVRAESRGPCELFIVVRLRPEHAGIAPIVRWEIAADRRFAHREQHGLAVVERGSTPELSLRITGLSPGRTYWYRVGREDCADCYTVGRLDAAAFGARAGRAAVSCRGPRTTLEGGVRAIRA